MRNPLLPCCATPTGGAEAIALSGAQQLVHRRDGASLHPHPLGEACGSGQVGQGWNWLEFSALIVTAPCLAGCYGRGAPTGQHQQQ